MQCQLLSKVLSTYFLAPGLLNFNIWRPYFQPRIWDSIARSPRRRRSRLPGAVIKRSLCAIEPFMCICKTVHFRSDSSHVPIVLVINRLNCATTSTGAGWSASPRRIRTPAITWRIEIASVACCPPAIKESDYFHPGFEYTPFELATTLHVHSRRSRKPANLQDGAGGRPGPCWHCRLAYLFRPFSD